MDNRDLTKGVGYRKTAISADEINQMVERGYSAKARETKVRKKESFAPSSIGYGNATCPRYWYMAFEGKYVFDESKTDNLGLAIMNNGVEVHSRLNQVFEDSGSLVASEIEMKMSDPPVRGFIDAMVRLDSGEVVVGEFKSMKTEMFQLRVNSMKPMPYHLYQILLYLKATDKQNGFLLYENKNDQTVLVLPVAMDDFNKKVINDALDWMRMVRKNWEDGPDGENLPKRPGRWTEKNKNCKGCPVFNECWNNLGDGNVDLPAMEVVKL